MQRIELQGGCYVTHRDQLDARQRESWSLSSAIDGSHGSRYLSLHEVRIENGSGPVWSAGDSDVVLFATDGAGEIVVSGRNFALSAGSALQIRSGEAFALSSGGALRALLSVCPQVPLRALDRMPDNFDANWPDRAVAGDMIPREDTGDRHFRLLLGKHNGSERVSLFLGHIPQSRAPEHYHLYEEALCVLSGAGRMWAGTSSAPVGPGSLVFLPREQPHCLECSDPAGMDVLGIFYPAGSPAVAYSADALS